MSPEDTFAMNCYMAGFMDGMMRTADEFGRGKSMRYLRTITPPTPNIEHFRELERQRLQEVEAEKN